MAKHMVLFFWVSFFFLTVARGRGKLVIIVARVLYPPVSVSSHASRRITTLVFPPASWDEAFRGV